MFGKPRNKNELPPPPIAETDSTAVEVVRVWAAPGRPQQVILRTTWEDAGAWGLMLVDIARHVAKAYAKEGQEPASVLARIHEMFEAEWSTPTDHPSDLHDS